ncbi:hypothetical protein E5288_WYG019788 [Bos mutus]|uniref:Uncharacterized protein n=1 Tax=Bos mutus TaxID=72004 RepID=A0A6B0RNU4_9CETA|nr:hypothetical protein [Bos mutus]
MVILYRKPAAAGERTRTPKDPSGPQWPQLTCPADLLLLPLAHLTKAHLCAFTASTECVPSDRGKRSGYYLKGDVLQCQPIWEDRQTSSGTGKKRTARDTMLVFITLCP